MTGARVLVTRPEPDNAATATALRARGHVPLLAPMLRFEAVAGLPDADTASGVILTSANAVRALRDTGRDGPLRRLPAYAVGQRTAEAARAAGFTDIHSADGDAASLVALIAAEADAAATRSAPLLYAAGEDTSRDIAGELSGRGFRVRAQIVYRMAPAETLPSEARAALLGGSLGAILHYSPRSAAVFVSALRDPALRAAAMAALHACLSDNVASPLRAAGATRLSVATAPAEASLLDALERAMSPRQ